MEGRQRLWHCNLSACTVNTVANVVQNVAKNCCYNKYATQSRRHSFHLVHYKQPWSGSTAQLMGSLLQKPVSELWVFISLVCRWKHSWFKLQPVLSCLVNLNGSERIRCFSVDRYGGSLSCLIHRCLYFHVTSCCFIGLWIGAEAKGGRVIGNGAESRSGSERGGNLQSFSPCFGCWNTRFKKRFSQLAASRATAVTQSNSLK